MIKVGVTGGIGAGKTTFCKVWQQLGAFVVYADELAKQIMGTNPVLIASIKKVFGEQSYHSDGSLHREFLAQEAFNKGRVQELNAIVHPVLWTTISELVEKKQKEGIRIFVKEAAILLQNGRPKDLDYVILLDANLDQRIERVEQRDQVQKKLILHRVSKQPNIEHLRSLVDYVVSNNSTEQALVENAKHLFNQIVNKK